MDPGYSFLAVTSLIDTHLNNGTLRFARYIPDTPTGVAYGEALSDMFYEAAPVKEFRKRYRLEKLPGTKYLLHAILKTYKEWGGKNKKPNIAILEFRQPFQTTESGENALIADMFRREGHLVEVVSPDQLEYRNGVLRRGEFRDRFDFPPDQGAGISGALRSDASVAARLSGARRVRGQ